MYSFRRNSEIPGIYFEFPGKRDIFIYGKSWEFPGREFGPRNLDLEKLGIIPIKGNMFIGNSRDFSQDRKFDTLEK